MVIVRLRLVSSQTRLLPTMTLYSTIIRVYCRVQFKKKCRVGACWSQHVSWNVVLTRADWSTSLKWQAGNSLSHFENGWGRLTIRCSSKSINNFRHLRDVFGLGPPLSEDGMSSQESRHPPDVTCGAAILIPRWWRRKWRQPRLGEMLLDWICLTTTHVLQDILAVLHR